MKVRAVVSFVGKVQGRTFRAVAGDVFELPEGVDWLRVGLVREAGGEGRIAKKGEGLAARREKAVVPGPVEVRAEQVFEDVMRPGHVDDLTLVRGIGPKTAEALGLMGIRRFGDLAAADAADLAARLDGASERQVRGWQAWLADDAQ